MVRIVLNADDFGKSIARNKAIDDSFKQSLICSTGLIVTGKHLKEAVDYMMSGGYVGKTHLHFNLSANLLHEDSDDAPLTEAMKKDAFFCKDGKFIRYKGLPRGLASIRKWKIVYNELVAQYNKYIEVTNGQGNNEHVDFHLWYNLTFPVALALNVFTRKFGIKSVRYIGLHHKSFRYRLFRMISWNPRVKSFPATNIDYFLSRHKSLSHEQVIELYCHPNYKEDVLLDDSFSYLKHERQPMSEQMRMLKELGNLTFISWEEINNE